MLQEQDRTKLDGIVKQMLANKESDQTVQTVVADFKSKYDKPEAPVITKEPGLLDKAVSYGKDVISGKKALIPPVMDRISQNLAKNYLNTATPIARDLLGLKDPAGIMGSNPIKEGYNTIKKGANLINEGKPLAGGATIAGGVIQGGGGTVLSALGTTYAPVIETIKEVMPQTGNKYIDSATQGATFGAGAAGPQGAIPGALIALGFTGLQDIESALLKIPELAKLNQENPEVLQNANNLISLALIALGHGKLKKGQQPDVFHQPLQDVPGTVMKNLTDTTNVVMSPITNKVVLPAVNAVASKVKNTVQDAKTLIERQNLPENLPTSIDRLAEKSKNSPVLSKEKDPLAKYDDYYKQEQKFKKDIKEDTALGTVGSEIGDNFEKVIQLKRSSGKAMGEEIKNVGKIKVDISKNVLDLEAQLKDSGMALDSTPKGVTVVASKTSKVSGQDLKMLQDYTKALTELGMNPSAAQVDAFLSRIPAEIKVYKNINNATGVTNGERIIMISLHDLTKLLSPEANQSFTNYFNARQDFKKYAEIVEEGSKFLGKETLSGDFAKDASLAKSSVQSILNNGKKDFLLRLEEVTGYPAIDNSMLAIQAMKDSGNFRGNSLLELLTQGGEGLKVPTSGSGVMDAITSKALKIGGDRIIGTPTEQTRAFIQTRMNQGKVKVPSQFNSLDDILSTQKRKINK